MENNNNREIPRQYAVKPYEPAELPPSPFIRYSSYEQQEDYHLRDYISVILKRKWIVLSFFVAVVITTAVVTFSLVPLYRSTVVIKIDKQNPNVLSFKGMTSNLDADTYETQREILKSRSLAERVIRKLNLDKNSDFLPIENKLSAMMSAVTNPIMKAFSYFMPSDPPDIDKKTDGKIIEGMQKTPQKEEVPVHLSNSLTRRLEVVPVKNSQLMKISFISHKPEISLNVANAVAHEYISYDLDSRVDAGTEAKEFLEKQIESAKTKVETSEKLLNEYASKNEIIYIDSDKQSVLMRKLSEISSSLNGETAERMRKEALYRQIVETGSSNPVIINNGLIQGMKSQYATLEAEYLNLTKTFTPDYPKMQNMKRQLDAIRHNIEKEEAVLTKSIESDYKTALKKEAYLHAAMEGQKRKVLDFQERAVQYQSLKREVEVNKELHNNLLQRLNEVGVAALSKSTNIQIVDRALYPKQPDKPNKTQNFFLSIVFGLLGGIGLAFLVDYFDNSVKDTDEIERRMHLTSLGMIPYQPQLNAERRPQVISSEFTNPVAEAFRSIGTFIMLSSATTPPRKILVTSPGAGEGKTTICVNIASALSETLGKGIIIDADMRRPKLHHSFNVDNKTGLSTCLSGNAGFGDLHSGMIKPTSVKELSILTSGPVPPNPSKLLHSTRMKDLLDALSEIYNFVIIDAPPIMGMPDSILLSSFVDGTILVVKAGQTQRNAITSAKQIFDNVNGNLLGVVLNGVKKDDLKYGSYSNYYSSYFKE
jgi:capsular exopolysaccharide synthesis family protein